jgi:hypothetical protein
MKVSAPRAGPIFLIIGALLLGLSYALTVEGEKEEFFASALSQIAFVVLTVAILDFFWNLLGGEPIKKTLDDLRSSVNLLSDSQSAGLMRIFSVSGRFGSFSDWMANLKSAQKNIDLMGYTLHVWTRGENFSEEVIQLTKRGVNIRVQIMSENNSTLDSLINAKQISTISFGAVKEEIRIMNKLLTDLEERTKANPGNLTFRPVSKGLIVNQICRFDGSMTVIPYLWSITASESPLFFIQGSDSELFRIYCNEFEKLWSLNEPTAPSR